MVFGAEKNETKEEEKEEEGFKPYNNNVHKKMMQNLHHSARTGT